MRTFSALRIAALACAAASFAGTASAKEPTSAQALFYEARTLMKEGQYAVACAKLDESLRLEYGIGTEFNLADCNERLGRVATAWSGFLHVAAAAREHRQDDRERLARERAVALEPRLSKVVFDVPASTPIDLTRDGARVDASSWGQPIPVDPGVHHVVATASGRRPWEMSIDVAEGMVLRIAVPAELGGEQQPEPAPPPAQAVDAGADVGRTQRIAGWGVGSAGLVALAVGIGFGIDSLRAGGSSRTHCAGDRCDARGVALRERAIQSGDAATAASLVGAAALAGGIALVLTAPRKATPGVQASAQPIAGGGALFLQGLLP